MVYPVPGIPLLAQACLTMQHILLVYMKIVMLEILNFFHKALAIVFAMSIFQ